MTYKKIKKCKVCDKKFQIEEGNQKLCKDCLYKECVYCGGSFKRKLSLEKKGFNDYCSHKCTKDFNFKVLKRRGFSWKGGVTKHTQGYVLEYQPENDRSNKSGYTPQHIIVMEKHLERQLKENEEIHHINHIRDDNRIENLQLCQSRCEHRRYDFGWWKDEKDNWWKVCNGCKLIFEVNDNNFYKRKTGGWIAHRCKNCCSKRI
jgi:hypothetical protein